MTPEPHVEPYSGRVKVALLIACPVALWAVIGLALL